MTFAGNRISYMHEGREYSATYTVNGGVVSVMMPDQDGALRGTSTYVNGSTSESVARTLLVELLRDIGLF
jgi:hypothetical protein